MVLVSVLDLHHVGLNLLGVGVLGGIAGGVSSAGTQGQGQGERQGKGKNLLHGVSSFLLILVFSRKKPWTRSGSMVKNNRKRDETGVPWFYHDSAPSNLKRCCHRQALHCISMAVRQIFSDGPGILPPGNGGDPSAAFPFPSPVTCRWAEGTDVCRASIIALHYTGQGKALSRKQKGKISPIYFAGN